MGNKILTVNEITNMSEADKINAYRQGYVLQELYTSSNILKLGMSTCPNNIQQGTTKNITSMVSLGTPNYVYKLYMKEATAVDFTELERYPTINAVPNTTPDVSHIFSHTFNEAVGSYIVKTEVIDSCTPIALSDESTCPVNITPLAVADICTWIDSKGGATALTVADIFGLVYAYQETIPIDFTPTITEIFGCVYYYQDNMPSGNAGTGCSY